MSEAILEVRGVSKRFPGVRALDGVSLSLHRGEVLAVIGENGAGKSTLMKILAGIEQPDSGAIVMDGRPVRIESVHDAMRLGIALIHQEIHLAGNLDAASNIFLGREPHTASLIHRRRIRRDAQPWLERVGLPIDPGTLVGTLPIGRQQLIEIAKALSSDARILIMDEPTSSLSLHETRQLFRVVRDLRGRGVSVIYISHRLGEVHEIADRVAVLRDGRNAGEIVRTEISHERMVRLMVGRDVSRAGAREGRAGGEVLLSVERVRTPAHPGHEVSLSLRAGEIVGLAGLVGAGRTELLQTIFGITRPRSGSIRVAGRALDPVEPIGAIRAGLALVPEDRKAQGLILDMAIRANVSLAALRRDQRLGFLNRRAERATSAAACARLNIRTPSDRRMARYLSGGNQQKVVLGKWLSLRPRVLLLDEPTRGIDVGSKQEIYEIMHRLVCGREAAAILFASSEMEEVLSLSDRVLVMHEGRLAGELPRDALSEEAVMRLATGATAQAAEDSERDSAADEHQHP